MSLNEFQKQLWYSITHMNTGGASFGMTLLPTLVQSIDSNVKSIMTNMPTGVLQAFSLLTLEVISSDEFMSRSSLPCYANISFLEQQLRLHNLAVDDVMTFIMNSSGFESSRRRYEFVSTPKSRLTLLRARYAVKGLIGK